MLIWENSIERQVNELNANSVVTHEPSTPSNLVAAPLSPNDMLEPSRSQGEVERKEGEGESSGNTAMQTSGGN
jgi:hypothetical protein